MKPGPCEAAFKAALESGMTEADAVAFAADYLVVGNYVDAETDGGEALTDDDDILGRIMGHCEAHLRQQ